LENSICFIYVHGALRGCGYHFGNGYIATCAHVVRPKDMDDVNVKFEIKDSNSHYFSEISNDKPAGSGWIFNLFVANYSLADFVLIDSHFRQPKSIITPTTGDVWMDRKNNSPKVEQLFGNWNRISENVTTLVQFSSLAPLAQQAATPCKLIIPGHTIDCTVQLVTESDLQNLSKLSAKGEKCAEILQEIYNQNNFSLAIVNGGNVEISEQLFSGYSGSPLVQIINGRASLLGTLFWSLPGHPTFVIKHSSSFKSSCYCCFGRRRDNGISIKQFFG